MPYQTLSDLLNADAMQQAQIGAMGQESQLRQLQMQGAMDDRAQKQQWYADAGQLRNLIMQASKSGGGLQSLMGPLLSGAAGMPGIEFGMKLQEAGRKEAFTLGEGQQRFEGGQMVASVPKAPKEFQPSDLARLTTEMNSLPPGDPRIGLYKNAITKMTTHAPGTSVSYGAPVAGQDAQGNPIFFQPGKTGGAPSIVPGVRPPQKDGAEKVPTEAEAKAGFYAGNMRAASKTYDALTSGGFDPSTGRAQIDTSLAGGWTNALAGKNARLAKQSQNQWSEQMLRMLTGAAATTDEINRNNATYFPQIGDGPAEVAQKKEMRRQAENGVFEASGRAKQRVGIQNAPAMDIHSQADAILNGGK